MPESLAETLETHSGLIQYDQVRGIEGWPTWSIQKIVIMTWTIKEKTSINLYGKNLYKPVWEMV